MKTFRLKKKMQIINALYNVLSRNKLKENQSVN